MRIPYLHDRDWKIYRTELLNLRCRHNYINCLILSGLIFFSCLVFFLQNLILPNREKFPWLYSAYSATFLIGVFLSLLFIAVLIILDKQKKHALFGIIVVIFAFVAVGLGTFITILDYFTYQNMTAVFIGSLGVCLLLSAEYWVYFALQAWIIALFSFGFAVILQDTASPVTILTLGFLVTSSLVLGLYLQYSRVKMQILSLNLENSNRELKAVMIRDPLTGAYNRLFLDEFLSKQLHCMKRYGECMSLLMLDIDRFKRVNDTLGHPVGDTVLKSLVTVIMRNVRDSDIVARIGGEEFLVALPRTSWENAFKIAEKLRKLIKGFVFESVPWSVTVSIGVGSLSPDEPLEAALARVDAALYLAKKSGRNRVEGFRSETPDFPVPG